MDIDFNNITKIQWYQPFQAPDEYGAIRIVCGDETAGGLVHILPVDDDNRQWKQIKERVDAGTLTIKDAD
tara:strand:+ start:1087 stop:1296 length:210 start_codon:yes stop_codon:yes gene_type:complete